MSRDPDDGDDRFDFDFSQAFPRAHRSRRQSADRRPRQQKAKRKFIADNFSPRRIPKEVQNDLAGVTPRRSLKRIIEEMVASNLNRSTSSIVAELERQGYEASPVAVSTIKQDIIKVIRLCRRHGSVIVPSWD